MVRHPQLRRCPKAVPHAVGSELYLSPGAPEGQIALDESNALGIRGHSWDVGVLGIGKQPRVFVAGTFYPLDRSGRGQLSLSQVAPFKGRGLSTRATNRGSTAERAILGQVCIG